MTPRHCKAAPTRFARREGRRAAGFTLIELMVVVMVIGLLAAMAIPSFRDQMRDRRTNQAAHEITLLYREARARALGRGSAVLVRFSGTGQGSVEVRESIGAAGGAPGQCLTAARASCTTTQWFAPGEDKHVDGFDPNGNPAYDTLGITLTGGAQLDVCFTPLGHTLSRPASSGAFQPLTTVPTLTVARGDGLGIPRTVLIPPNGLARLGL